MPDFIHRFNAWRRRLFATAGAWFRGKKSATTTPPPEVFAPSDSADAMASQPWQASAQAHGFTTPPPDRQSPPLRALGLTNEAMTGADIAPQLTSLNPQSPAPFTPRPLAAHISRPLTARLDPTFDAPYDASYDTRPDTRPGIPSTFMPPPIPAPGQLPTAPYQTSGPNDDTLPPRVGGLPGLPAAQSFPGADDTAPLGALDATTLPDLTASLHAEPAETTAGSATDETPDHLTDYAPYPLPLSDRDADVRDADDADDDDDDDDGQPTDKLAVDDALARALSGRDDALSAFDAADGSPVTRRRMFFLRYLVRRRVYNEGFAPGEAPEQYHHSLGLDDDGADDTLPGM